MNIYYLSDEDQEIMDFLVLSIHLAVRLAEMRIDWSPETIEAVSESNWREFEITCQQNLDEYKDFCFSNTEEEELLALIEDSLDEDMDRESKAILWICGITIVQAIYQTEENEPD